MKIKLHFIFVFLIIIFVLSIFFKSLFENKNYIPEKIINKLENQSIIEFYSNKNYKLKELFASEDYIIINIWASWCVPCRQEHLYITNLSTVDNLKIVGLNYKDKKNNAQKFLNDLGNPYDIILIDKNGTESIFLGAYGVPETFLIDSELNILKKYIGPINLEDELEIKKLIK